jgi:hypothetical protein
VIIVIGCNSKINDDLAALRNIAAFFSASRPDLSTHILADNLDHYDMETRPEKGDALNAINDETELVIALHIFGIDGRVGCAGGKGQWGYNRDNANLLSICLAKRIPLIAFGDQPVNALNPGPANLKSTQIASRTWMYESAPQPS